MTTSVLSQLQPRSTMQVYHLLNCVFLLIPSSLGAPRGGPKYDQRQEGEMNVRADLSNILIMIVPSGGVRLVDNDQLGSILQIFSKASKTPDKQSPYKVDIDKAAIDKLESDMENINSILPIRKSLIDVEKKEIPEVKTEEASANSSVPAEVASTTSEAPSTTSEVTATVEAVVSLKTTEKSDSEKVIKQTSKEDKEKNAPTSKTSLEKSDSSVKEKVVQISPIGVTVYAPKATSTSTNQGAAQKTVQEKSGAKNPKSIEQTEEKLAALKSGIRHCKPDQTMTPEGDCIETDDRESRSFSAEDLERLLTVLRFGLEPANQEN